MYGRFETLAAPTRRDLNGRTSALPLSAHENGARGDRH